MVTSVECLDCLPSVYFQQNRSAVFSCLVRLNIAKPVEILKLNVDIEYDSEETNMIKSYSYHAMLMHYTLLTSRAMYFQHFITILRRLA